MKLKWVFFALLFVNIAFAAYLLFREPPPAVVTGEKSAQGLVPLVLVEEAPERSEVETDSLSTLTGGVSTVSATLCRNIGPLADRTEARRVAGMLSELVQTVRINQEEQRRKLGYRVIIAPQSSRDAAERLLQQLRQLGEKDVWLFRSGELENGLSLGLFSQRSNAEGRREAIVDKGFRAEMRPRFADNTEYWLAVELRPEAANIEEWLAERDFALESMSVECPER